MRALVIPSRMAFTDRNPLNIYVDISAMYELNSCGVDYYTLGSLLCVASTLGFHVVCVVCVVWSHHEGESPQWTKQGNPSN